MVPRLLQEINILQAEKFVIEDMFGKVNMVVE
jgi:hypothetical protein